MSALTHVQRLEAESQHIFCEVGIIDGDPSWEI